MVMMNQDTINNVKNKLMNMWNDVSTSSIMMIITIILSLTIILGLFAYITDKLSLRQRRCNNLSEIYENFPKISSFNKDDKYFQHTLKDYYIKSAYNACSVGRFKNSFVDLCALKEVIRQGYRCLDMAIYSVDNNPVVATSSVNSYDVKQTYNSIPFESVCEIISNNAFSGSACPNPNDPLIIHLRLLSNNNVICNKISEAITSHLSNYVMGKKYSYENNGRNFGDIKLNELQKKVIIIVDKTNPMFQGTKLEEYVNLTSNSVFMQAMRFDKLKYVPDINEQKEYNKTHMTLVMPNLNEKDDNISSALAFEYGCQMVAMSVQNYDSNLLFYDKKFNQAGSAFILKPDELRYQPVVITVPAPPPEDYSFAPREIASDYYNHGL